MIYESHSLFRQSFTRNRIFSTLYKESKRNSNNNMLSHRRQLSINWLTHSKISILFTPVILHSVNLRMYESASLNCHLCERMVLLLFFMLLLYREEKNSFSCRTLTKQWMRFLYHFMIYFWQFFDSFFYYYKFEVSYYRK